MKATLNIFIALIFTGIVVLLAWPLLQKVVKKRQAVYATQTATVPEASAQDSTTTTVDHDHPLPVADEQVALPPQPPPSILAFLENHLHPEEMKLLREMNCFSVVNMEEHNDRANNLAPSMMARITMMQRRQDSLLLDVAIIKQRLSMTHQDSIEFIRDFMRNNPQYFTDKKNKKKKK